MHALLVTYEVAVGRVINAIRGDEQAVVAAGEDSFATPWGKLYTSNAEQVNRVRRIFAELGIEVATPEEARNRLGTKGKEAQGF